MPSCRGSIRLRAVAGLALGLQIRVELRRLGSRTAALARSVDADHPDPLALGKGEHVAGFHGLCGLQDA